MSLGKDIPTTKNAYMVAKLSVHQYIAISDLLKEAGIVVEEAWENLGEDAVLELIGSFPGLGGLTSVLSFVGDLQMYADMISIVLAVEAKSTKVGLRGTFTQNGSIIPGNQYRPGSHGKR